MRHKGSKLALPRFHTLFRLHSEPFAGLSATFVLGLVLSAIQSGCATTVSGPYPYFEHLAIEAVPIESSRARDAVASAGDLAVGGAAAGAMGTFFSGLATSLVCGPYFAVCFAGTGAATLGGATVGAVIAGSTALSAEETEQVISRLEDLPGSNELSDDMAVALSTRLPTERHAGPKDADARLSLTVQNPGVFTGFGDTVGLGVTVTASLEWGPDQAKPRRAMRRFSCQTKSSPLQEWLESDDSILRQGLSHCIDDLAGQIDAALRKPAIDPGADSSAPVGFGTYDPAISEW